MKRSESSGCGTAGAGTSPSRATPSQPTLPSQASPSGGLPLPAIHGFDDTAVQDWLRVHRQLVALEAEFSDIAMRVAMGDLGTDELKKKRNEPVGMRELCTAVYEKAFGGPPVP